MAAYTVGIKRWIFKSSEVQDSGIYNYCRLASVSVPGDRD
jgi:hypothetical protein